MAAHTKLDSALHAERQFEGFENLMPFRVNDILLVSSLYDSFILREDGRLNRGASDFMRSAAATLSASTR